MTRYVWVGEGGTATAFAAVASFACAELWQLLVPRMVKASDGIEPTSFSSACDGPLFSSQYTGSPLGTLAFCRFTQYVSEFSVGPSKLVVTVQTLKPNSLLEHPVCVKFTV